MNIGQVLNLWELLCQYILGLLNVTPYSLQSHHTVHAFDIFNVFVRQLCLHFEFTLLNYENLTRGLTIRVKPLITLNFKFLDAIVKFYDCVF